MTNSSDLLFQAVKSTFDHWTALQVGITHNHLSRGRCISLHAFHLSSSSRLLYEKSSQLRTTLEARAREKRQSGS